MKIRFLNYCIAISVLLLVSTSSCETQVEIGSDMSFKPDTCEYYSLRSVRGDFYMYVGNERHVFEVVPNKMLVRHIDSVEIRQSLQRMSASTLNFRDYGDGFMLVELENTSREQAVDIVAQWNVLETNANVSPILSREGDIQISFVPNQFSVRLKHESDYSLLLQKLESYPVKSIEPCSFIPGLYRITLSEAHHKTSMQIANELHRSGLFKNAAPEVLMFIERLTNATYFQQQWGLHGTFGIRAPQAWAITTGSPNIRIAILDSGVDLGHPDLEDNLLTGFNATTGALDGSVVWSDPNYAHGTAVAGIAAAVGNNIAGVAYNSKVLPIFDGGLTSTARIVAAINWAVNNGADVINISSRYVEHIDINDAIRNAVTTGRNGLGTVIVASSGNGINRVGTTTVVYPARHPDVIAVGAINSQGVRAPFSDHGPNLDVVAPGVGIFTTDVRGIPGRPGYTALGNKYFSNFEGTSASAPFVAGVAALILSVRPDLRAQQVRNIIKSTANRGLPGFTTHENRPNGTWNRYVGHGLVNAYEAVRSVAPSISGAATVCPGTTNAVFTLQNRPTGATVSVRWIADAPLVIVGDDNLNTVTVRHTGATTPANSQIRAEIIANGQVVNTVRRNVTVNRPVIHSIQVHSATTGGTSLSVNHTGGATFDWSISPSHGVHLGFTNTNLLLAHIPFPGTYTVTVTVSNACGTATMSRSIVVTGEIHHPITTCPHCGTTSDFPPGCFRCPHNNIIHREEEEES